MPYFVSFLFSPFGYASRGAWWFTRLVYPLICAALLVYLFWPLLFDPHLQALGKNYRDAQFAPAEAVRINNYVIGQLPSLSDRLWVILPMFALIFWSSFVIEIKRWHDRGMSGFWVLLDFFPSTLRHLQDHPFTGFEIILIAGIGLFQLIQLGFLGTVLDQTPIGGKSKSVQPEPTRGHTSTILTVILGLLLAAIVAFAGLGYFSKRHTVPPSSSSGRQDSSGDTFVRGTTDTNFATDWVVFHGKKIEGITSAKPTSDGNVVILYSDGVLHVPASSLPQGFLDAWKIKVRGRDDPPDKGS